MANTKEEMFDSLVCVPGEHCLMVCGSAEGCTNLAYPKLVLGIMPSGARGLMMAVMVAALMSDLDSIFNSASAIFTLDLWKKARNSASNKELMVVGRLFVILLIVISILWVPIIQNFQGGQLFFYIQEVTNYMSPPIAAVFMIGVLWPRCTEQGAFYGGLCGSFLGFVRLIIIFFYTKPICGEPDLRPSFLKDLQYMYYAAMLFFVTLVVAIVVSLFTVEPNKEMVNRLTYWNRFGPSPPAADEMIAMKENDFVEKEPVSPYLESDYGNRNKTDYSPRCLLRKLVYFVCGFDEKKIEPEVTYPSLEQDPLAKKWLLVGLFCIMSCGVFLYIFWSV